MLVRTLTIFAVTYAVLFVLGVTLFRMANQIFDLSAMTQNAGFMLNLMAFIFASLSATSWRHHNRFGRASGPLAFSSFLVASRPAVTIGIAVLATAIDACLYAVSSWFSAGGIILSHVGRLAILLLIYAVLAWIVVTDSSKRRV